MKKKQRRWGEMVKPKTTLVYLTSSSSGTAVDNNRGLSGWIQTSKDATFEVQVWGPHPYINLLHVSEERHNLHPNKCARRLLSLQNGRHSIREEKQGFTWRICLYSDKPSYSEIQVRTYTQVPKRGYPLFTTMAFVWVRLLFFFFFLP